MNSICTAEKKNNRILSRLNTCNRNLGYLDQSSFKLLDYEMIYIFLKHHIRYLYINILYKFEKPKIPQIINKFTIRIFLFGNEARHVCLYISNSLNLPLSDLLSEIHSSMTTSHFQVPATENLLSLAWKHTWRNNYRRAKYIQWVKFKPRTMLLSSHLTLMLWGNA